MIDLLAQTPFYDSYLAQALVPLVDRFTLYSIRFHYELNYFDGVRFHRSPGMIDLVSGLQLKTPSLRRAGKLMEYFLNWSYLLCKFHRQPPDVIHVQWLPLLSRTGWELRMAKRFQRLGLPMAYTVHNYLPHDLSPHRHERFRQAYTIADHLIVHTEVDRNRLVNDLGLSPEKISIIPHGPLFLEQAGTDREQARAALSLQSKDIVLLIFGVIRPYKGIEETVQALAKVIKLYPCCKLLIAGQSLDRDYLIRVKDLTSKLGIQSHVEWHTQYIHSSKIGVFYAAADIALCPYRDISQSGAFLTAAALGKFTLTTKVGGLAEIVRDGETGLQVDSSDPETLADGLRRCLELTPAERSRMGSALRDYVLQHCNWALAAQQTVDVYRQAAKHHG
jgi:glycosyltransferase involved in cell wall biosynthesis